MFFTRYSKTLAQMCFPALTLLLFHLLALHFTEGEISCKNEKGESVDWFIIYKLPKYKINESVGTGLDYMYLDPTLPSWQRSRFLVNDSQGALWYTLGQLYQDHKSKSNTSAYLLYNDDPPLLDYKKNHGHTKGTVLFDMEQGFWLSHSVPRFPPFPEKGYGWPPTGKRNGQTALCVTYRGAQFVSIAEQLLLYNPRVYNCSLPEIFMPMFSNLSILCQGVRVPISDKKQAMKLTSSRGETFVNFAKSQYYVDDIYTAWVAQDLKSNLLTETWQEKEHELPPNCSLPEHVYNVKRIQLPGPHFFYSQYDHSKWCVSQNFKQQWTCIGDLNREDRQAWKAGGLICTQNPIIYMSFRKAVSWYKGC
ncbi:deoxyribonuclease-2-beta-like [Erpetoichthys calabaricus]|uniref:deoxyribonuclease-2-beta-like n=1 Tax=Erpetoichthys calabaricus TaxID=27687 RepID=UPI0022343A06|nr:deoxyribonuclease-2-beta-like [Erpetoichthys calabaricus]